MTDGGAFVAHDIFGERAVVAVAEDYGFRLLQRDLDTGNVAWTWLPDNDGPQARFLTRRQAIFYMSDRLHQLGS